MKRVPVRRNRPSCYSSFKGSRECKQCKYRVRCRKLSKFFAGVVTVAEGCQQAVDPTRTTRQWLRFFSDRLDDIGYPGASSILHSSRYMDCTKSIVAACQRENVNPELYFIAQVETMGKWAVATKRRLYANMIVGKNAQHRFEDWLDKNRRRYADYHRTQKEDNCVLAGELLFAEVYLSGTLSIKEAETAVRKMVKGWKKRSNDYRVRFQALRSYLASVSSVLPYQIFLPLEGWKWGHVRKCLRELL